MGANKVVFVGGGGHCLSVIDSARGNKSFDGIVITDPMIPPGTDIFGCRVVGDDSVLSELKRQGYSWAFITVGCIGDPSLRRELAKNVERLGFEFPVIIDNSATVSQFSSVLQGAFVAKGAIVNVNSCIGVHSIINSGAVVEHDCYVGDYSHVSVGAVLCGNVKIGEGCFIGAGSRLIQGVNVGNNCVIGAGSLVLSDVPDDTKVLGTWNK